MPILGDDPPDKDAGPTSLDGDVKESLALEEVEIIQHATIIARLLYDRGVIRGEKQNVQTFTVVQNESGLGVQYCRIMQKYIITIPRYVPNDTPAITKEDVKKALEDEERRDAQENDLDYMED